MDDFEIDVSGNAKRWVRGPSSGRRLTAGEVGTFAQLRNGQVDRPRPRVPRPAPVAVAAVRAVLRALAVGGAADRVASSPITRSQNSFTISRSRSVSAYSICLRTHSRPPIVVSPTVLLLPSSYRSR
jgi:hypothetical protein